jgi:competence protein ComEC
MINWHSIPFARLLIPFTIGIVVYNCSPGTLPFAFMLMILACTFLLFEKTIKIQAKFKFKIWTSIAIISLLMCFGAVRQHCIKANLSKRHYSNVQGIRYLKFEVVDVIESKNNKLKIEVEVINAIDSLHLKTKPSGRLLINLTIDSSAIAPKIGETYWTKAKLTSPYYSENPGTFDYPKYLRRKQIFHVINASKDHLIKSNELFYHIRKTAYALRDYSLEIIKTNIPNKLSYGISEALLLGYKSDLEEETNLIFTRTGTLHILAVSGMHAGLIFAILNWVFGFLVKFKKGNILKAIIILGCLWFYALMSGLSASVIRAAVMFSLMTIGKLVNRTNNPINTIYSSAFIMLVYDPNFLFDPGFQLSYAAVLGIGFCYSKIRGLYSKKNKPIVAICDLINVSICAQLLTFPISIFYFNQFPSYFLITNLIVIPIYTLLIFLIIAIFPLSYFPFIGLLIGRIIDFLIYYNDIFMQFMDGLPLAVINNLGMDYIELCLLYAIVLLIVYGIYYKIKTTAIGLLIVLAILTPYKNFTSSNTQNQRFICLMGFRNDNIFVCVDGEKSFIYGDSLSFTEKSIKNDLSKFFLKYKIRSKYMVQEKKSFVSTNFRSISGLGFQFFDRIVTMQNTAQLNRQNNLYFLVGSQEKKPLSESRFISSNLIISHKIKESQRHKFQNELLKRFGKKINISTRFRMIYQF